MKPLSLYFHIPFCARKCFYCDFLSFDKKQDYIEPYMQALKKEIISYQEILKPYEIKTIFIGGGTPSILTPLQTEEFMKQVHKSFRLAPEAEISIECNPGTLTEEKLSAYRSIGINRISMGLQSSEDQTLKDLGRIHTRKDFEKNFNMMRKTGYDNINVDLIFGLPNQKKENWNQNLKYIKELDPEHISVYGLIVEEGTLFHEKYQQNCFPLPNEDEERDMYWDAHHELTKAGYNHYEISNYSKEGYACRHNIVYWTMEEYIGIGLGASSYFNGMRMDNCRDLKQYIQSDGNLKEINSVIHPVPTKEKKEEYLFLGLRLLQGIDLDAYKKEFFEDIEKTYGSIINELIKDGMLLKKNRFLFLTQKGIDLSNYVFSKFLLD